MSSDMGGGTGGGTPGGASGAKPPRSTRATNNESKNPNIDNVDTQDGVEQSGGTAETESGSFASDNKLQKHLRGESGKQPKKKSETSDLAKDGNKQGTSEPQGSDNPNTDGQGQGGDADKKDGLIDRAKDHTSNATGVDYSDKNLQGQLEHQAADVAMDVTPVLGELNKARKELKKANAMKREAKQASGKFDADDKDLLDGIEDVADKGVEAGITGAKVSAAIPMAALAGNVGIMGMALLNVMIFAKAMLSNAVAALGKIAAFISNIFTAISTAVASVVGVAVATGKVIVSIFAVIVTVATVIVGGAVVEEVTVKKDSSSADTACVPTKQRPSESDLIGGFVPGDANTLQPENAQKMYSILGALGGSKLQVSAVLGNFHYESQGLDSTAVENVTGEEFQIGPKKVHAESVGFDRDVLKPGYKTAKIMGIGLAQWSNSRNTLLLNYAKDNNLDWYDFGTQVSFMLYGDNPADGKLLQEFVTRPGTDVGVETRAFLKEYERTSEDSLSKRTALATEYYFLLDSMSVDQGYADGILSIDNQNKHEGNTQAGSYHQDDGCGNQVKSHFGNKNVDGTGSLPEGFVGVYWRKGELPAEVQKFAYDPVDAGLGWQSPTGWYPGIQTDQCVGFASSYFTLIYPDWDKKGRAKDRPRGNGNITATGWATHYKSKVVSFPLAGSVFSHTNTPAGHTGIVQHVFANGNMLITETNINGVSGGNNGETHTWNYKIVPTETYTSQNWMFFKPTDAEPRWDTKKSGPVSSPDYEIETDMPESLQPK